MPAKKGAPQLFKDSLSISKDMKMKYCRMWGIVGLRPMASYNFDRRRSIFNTRWLGACSLGRASQLYKGTLDDQQSQMGYQSRKKLDYLFVCGLFSSFLDGSTKVR